MALFQGYQQSVSQQGSDAVCLDILHRLSLLPREKQELVCAMIETYIEKTKR